MSKIPKKISFFFLFIFFSYLNLYSQSTSYQSKFIDILNESNNTIEEEIKTSSALLDFYKKFISSQDHKNCPYHPSCSVYAYQSIQKYGLLSGIIRGVERLSRCNMSQKDKYTLTKDSKLIDHP